ncbi:hypothetical protein GF351_06050 [Candidatus Woesearchaeota archaeon]|nr:hypothetical protein [Candidatus Woesearchaeota archaeon]
MRSIIFDTGPLISLTMNNLLWILEPLKRQFKGQFFITKDVKREIIDKPLQSKRFKFEALQVASLLDDRIIELISSKSIRERSSQLLYTANRCFSCKKNPLRVIQLAEMETLAAAVEMDADACAVDERTTRMLLEDPYSLRDILKKKLHCKVQIDRKKVKEFRKQVKKVKIIRSIELIVMAYEMGLLDKYLPGAAGDRKTLLDSVLWGAKIDGCAVSAKEIDQIIELERRKIRKSSS